MNEMKQKQEKYIAKRISDGEGGTWWRVWDKAKQAFSNWYNFNQPNSRKAQATNAWLRIDNRVFAGCYSGTLQQLRKKLDSGESTPEREKDWKIISKPF